MARSGGRSQWEREIAAQRREAERQTREQARLAKERERAAQQRHIESQQRTAELRTSEVEQQARILDKVLTSVLRLPALTFDSLKADTRAPGLRARALESCRVRTGLERLRTPGTGRLEPRIRRSGPA